MSRPPLYGRKTHPLSPHAADILRGLCGGPWPAQEINPGVINRLLREDLIVMVQKPSPYQTGKGQPINFAEITPAGRNAVAAMKGTRP